MIELKNSKTQYLGKVSGRDRYMLDAFIGAVQMREPEGKWQDIRPRLVRNTDGWHVEGAPYYAEIKDSGERLFYPEHNERGNYLKIPAPVLFNNLDRNVVSNPAKLDGALTPSQITLPTDWGEYHIIFSNTGMHFEILFAKPPPSDVFGKDSPKILLDIETTGIDIEQLLKSRAGIGIPRPRLIAANLEALSDESPIRWLDWSFKNGQLELGFDFGDLPFPILLKNTTIDVQVDTGTDDGWGRADNQFDNAGRLYIGQYIGYDIRCFYLFDGLNDFGGGTIGTAYTQLNRYYGGSYSPANVKIKAQDTASPSVPSNATETFALTPTSNGVDWDGTQANGWNQSPSIVNVIQELADSFGSITAVQILLDNDYEGSGSYFWESHSYNTNSSYAPKLHIEYTTGGATPKTATETGAGAGASSLLVDIVEGDAAGGSEGIKGRSVTLKDDGGGTDAFTTLFAGVLAGEAGSGLEQSTLTSLVVKLSAEAGSGIDTAGLSARLASSETGTGADIGAIPGQKNLFDGDEGIGGDTLKILIGTSATGSDMKLPGHQSHVRIPSKGVSL
jgi:hypothetical protein